MELEQVLREIIIPAMAQLPAKMSSDAATVELLTIGQQESRFKYRYQVVGGGKKGPARSFWQGEEGGGMVTGVMRHPATKDIAAKLYAAHGVPANPHDVWLAIENDDILACALARLLLWTDPRALPATDDAGGAWDLYNRVWRPGKPHPETWAGFHLASRQMLGLA